MGVHQYHVEVKVEFHTQRRDYLVLVSASGNADLTLHQEAGGALSKLLLLVCLIFAMDRLEHKRLWLRYSQPDRGLTCMLFRTASQRLDMHALQDSQPETFTCMLFRTAKQRLNLHALQDSQP